MNFIYLFVITDFKELERVENRGNLEIGEIEEKKRESKQTGKKTEQITKEKRIGLQVN